MTRFVWLEAPGGGFHPVNPAQVAYLKPRGEDTVLIFGAFAGGLHELVVKGDGKTVVDQLNDPSPEDAIRHVFAAMGPVTPAPGTAERLSAAAKPAKRPPKSPRARL